MITIVTDTTSYFKKNHAEELGIKLIPISYTIDGKNCNESYSDQNGDVEALLRGKENCTTAHPNIGVFLSCFEDVLKNGNEVLCITLSSRLSGAYTTACAAAKQTKSKNVAVFDSQYTAGGLYLIIKEAAKLIEKGMSLDEISKKLPGIRERISVAFSVDDMTPLRNSGRIGFVRMSVCTYLNIRPVLTCKDGAIVSDDIVRGNTELMKKFVSRISKDAQEIVINYIGDNQLASNVYHILKDKFKNADITLQKIGPALGIHLGLKAIGISCLSSSAEH